MKIHKSLLPNKIKSATDKDGFIHGYFVFLENDQTACFFVDNKVLFECTKPIIVSQTHLCINYLCVVFTGVKNGLDIGELRRLTMFF